MTKESLRNEHGAEYWSARDLQPLLGYGQWRRFEDAIKRAVTSCKQSGNEPNYHFANAGKMIEIGKGGKEKVNKVCWFEDCKLKEYRPEENTCSIDDLPVLDTSQHIAECGRGKRRRTDEFNR